MESAPVKMAIYLRTAACVLLAITKTKIMNAYVSHAINLFFVVLLSDFVAPPCDNVESRVDMP